MYESYKIENYLQFKVLEMMKYVTVSITRVESVIQYTFWAYKYEGNIILY